MEQLNIINIINGTKESIYTENDLYKCDHLLNRIISIDNFITIDKKSNSSFTCNKQGDIFISNCIININGDFVVGGMETNVTVSNCSFNKVDVPMYVLNRGIE